MKPKRKKLVQSWSAFTEDMLTPSKKVYSDDFSELLPKPFLFINSDKELIFQSSINPKK